MIAAGSGQCPNLNPRKGQIVLTYGKWVTGFIKALKYFNFYFMSAIRRSVGPKTTALICKCSIDSRRRWKRGVFMLILRALVGGAVLAGGIALAGAADVFSIHDAIKEAVRTNPAISEASTQG